MLKRTVLESNLLHPFISGPETSGKMFLSVKVRGEARPGAKGSPAQTGAPLWFATFLWPRKKNKKPKHFSDFSLFPQPGFPLTEGALTFPSGRWRCLKAAWRTPQTSAQKYVFTDHSRPETQSHPAAW